jgi:mitochondrial import receptor subunit TOM40
MKDCGAERESPPKCYPYDERTNWKKQPGFPPNFKIVKGRTNFLNPGNVEDLHKRARDVMPVWLEGVQLNLRKSVSSSVAVKNSWVLSHNTPSGFRFGGTYYAKAVGDVLVSMKRFNFLD